MPSERKRHHKDGQTRPIPRGMWSGTISFGLVSVPVNLVAGVRPGGVPLHMLDRDGTPLKRRYFCPEHNREIHPEHIIRGFEVEDERFVPITAEELEQLEPEKSRDIDLKLFVDLESIDPIYFERPYFLLPGGENEKAYRLLTEAMESANKAGIARFVMREKEYLVAIIAENGLLRAQTMRFHDEVRTPEEVGIEEDDSHVRSKVAQISKSIKSLAKPSLTGADLRDHRTERLLALIEEKASKGQDVLESVVAAAEPDEPNVMNLMQAISESVAAAKRESTTKKTTSRGTRAKDRHGRSETTQAARFQSASDRKPSRRPGRPKRNVAGAGRRHERD